MTSILGVIPARYASTRFPAKALHEIKGKSMVQRVYEQAIQSNSLSKLVVATDHKKIYDHVIEFGGEAIMTSTKHPSGTDRCFEALQKIEGSFDYVLNIQGDEPFIQPEQIDTLAHVLLDRKGVELATLIKKIDDDETLFDPNEVKVVIDAEWEAVYFSRHPIPYLHQIPKEQWLQKFDFYKHIGMYAYRSDVLEKITQLDPSNLEQAEGLEQLRWLENSFNIRVAITDIESYCIDVPEDLEHPAIKEFIDALKN
ncbi:MAG: 3-deoxy-manno-octulosonate cytidylyltransferase [Raineya sp.]|jgi:3-deoxy-manno-octulosonate cytidylyltransferase (CMP-KDO synthetase)|nr:3-deoxy-manno-octulosonate cytidylyltransferase [Raineya sp.]